MKKLSPEARAVLLDAVQTGARDLVGVAGVVCVVVGVGMIYAPAAWIVAGLALAAWAVLKARGAV